jgi:hypothetical protein
LILATELIFYFEQIRFLGDPTGKFTEALDLSFDSSAIFGNNRSKRYVLLVEDGKVKEAFVEPDNTGLNGMSLSSTYVHCSMLTLFESFRCREGARLKSSLDRSLISLQIPVEGKYIMGPRHKIYFWSLLRGTSQCRDLMYKYFILSNPVNA